MQPLKAIADKRATRRRRRRRRNGISKQWLPAFSRCWLAGWLAEMRKIISSQVRPLIAYAAQHSELAEAERQPE